MIRWLCALAVETVVTGFAFLLITGRYINDGPVLVTVAQEHGVHTGDLFVVAGWVVSTLAVLALAAMPGRDTGR